MADKKKKHLSFWDAVDVPFHRPVPWHDVIYISANSFSDTPQISSSSFPTSASFALPPASLHKTSSINSYTRLCFLGYSGPNTYSTAPAEGLRPCLHQITLPPFRVGLNRGEHLTQRLPTRWLSINRTLDLDWKYELNKFNSSLGNWELEKQEMKLASSRLWHQERRWWDSCDSLVAQFSRGRWRNCVHSCQWDPALWYSAYHTVGA